jgi:hypothetical protein
MSDLIYTEKEFLDTSSKVLVEQFNLHKKMTVIRSNKDELQLEWVKGTSFNIRFTELIAFRHYVYIPPHPTDPEKEPTYSLKLNKPLSPLSNQSAIRKVKYILNNISQGKSYSIKDLTEEEIDFIVHEMNKPIGHSVDVTNQYRKPSNV